MKREAKLKRAAKQFNKWLREMLLHLAHREQGNPYGDSHAERDCALIVVKVVELFASSTFRRPKVKEGGVVDYEGELGKMYEEIMSGQRNKEKHWKDMEKGDLSD